jgi:hypothetical protein
MFFKVAARRRQIIFATIAPARCSLTAGFKAVLLCDTLKGLHH